MRHINRITFSAIGAIILGMLAITPASAQTDTLPACGALPVYPPCPTALDAAKASDTVSYVPASSEPDPRPYSLQPDFGKGVYYWTLKMPENLLAVADKTPTNKILTEIDGAMYRASIYEIAVPKPNEEWSKAKVPELFATKLFVPDFSDAVFEQMGMSWTNGNLYITPVPAYTIGGKKVYITKPDAGKFPGRNKDVLTADAWTNGEVNRMFQHTGVWDPTYNRSIVWEFIASSDNQGLEITITGLTIVQFDMTADRIDKLGGSDLGGRNPLSINWEKGDKITLLRAEWGFFPVTVTQPDGILSYKQPVFNLMDEEPVGATFQIAKSGEMLYARLGGQETIFEVTPRPEDVGQMYSFLRYEHGKAGFWRV